MLKILKSINTGLYIFVTAMIFFLLGSLYIPQNLHLFSDVNDMPLFKWLSINSANFIKTYWIYILIILMAVLSLNMVVCMIDDISKRFSPRLIVQKLSPHIIHCGVLIILSGHLISASTGFKKDISIGINEEVILNGLRIRAEGVRFDNIKGEDQSRWIVNLLVNENGVVRRFVLEPSRPAFFRYGFYAKSAERSGRLIIGVISDPGAIWEVSGAILFIIGSTGLFWTRYRIEGEGRTP
jgi:hypothetical protein